MPKYIVMLAQVTADDHLLEPYVEAYLLSCMVVLSPFIRVLCTHGMVVGGLSYQRTQQPSNLRAVCARSWDDAQLQELLVLIPPRLSLISVPETTYTFL